MFSISMYTVFFETTLIISSHKSLEIVCCPSHKHPRYWVILKWKCLDMFYAQCFSTCGIHNVCQIKWSHVYCNVLQVVEVKWGKIAMFCKVCRTSRFKCYFLPQVSVYIKYSNNSQPKFYGIPMHSACIVPTYF
jgi:hypothetical protein